MKEITKLMEDNFVLEYNPEQKKFHVHSYKERMLRLQEGVIGWIVLSFGSEADCKDGAQFLIKIREMYGAQYVMGFARESFSGTLSNMMIFQDKLNRMRSEIINKDPMEILHKNTVARLTGMKFFDN